MPHGSRQPAREEEAGFTLVELLVVMVILGVLAGIVVFGVGGLNKASAAAACRADFKTVETAQAAYESQTGRPAPTVDQLLGVWLKDRPANTNDYRIAIDPHGDVTVQSVNPAHAPKLATPTASTPERAERAKVRRIGPRTLGGRCGPGGLTVRFHCHP